MDICGGQAIYLTPFQCNDCSSLTDRISELEDKLNSFQNINISGTDRNGNTTTVVVLSPQEG